MMAEAGGIFKNVYYDTAASPLLYGQDMWREFLSKTGASRVLFGSDFPLNNYPRETETAEMGRLLAELRGAGLSEEELAALLATNARGLGMTRG